MLEVDNDLLERIIAQQNMMEDSTNSSVMNHLRESGLTPEIRKTAEDYLLDLSDPSLDTLHTLSLRGSEVGILDYVQSRLAAHPDATKIDLIGLAQSNDINTAYTAILNLLTKTDLLASDYEPIYSNSPHDLVKKVILDHVTNQIGQLS
jgi:hypothetical protein